MYKNKKSIAQSKKLTIALIILLILVVTIAITFKVLESNRQSQIKQSNSEDTSSSQNTSTLDPASNSTLNQTSTDTSPTPESKTPIQNEPVVEDVAPTSQITGYINNPHKVEDKLVIRLTIHQLLSSSGTCKLTLSSGTTIRTYQAPVINNPSSASCQGFDIPTTDLFTGRWVINVEVISEDKTGNITGEVTL